MASIVPGLIRGATTALEGYGSGRVEGAQLAAQRAMLQNKMLMDALRLSFERERADAAKKRADAYADRSRQPAAGQDPYLHSLRTVETQIGATRAQMQQTQNRLNQLAPGGVVLDASQQAVVDSLRQTLHGLEQRTDSLTRVHDRLARQEQESLGTVLPGSGAGGDGAGAGAGAGAIPDSARGPLQVLFQQYQQAVQRGADPDAAMRLYLQRKAEVIRQAQADATDDDGGDLGDDDVTGGP